MSNFSYFSLTKQNTIKMGKHTVLSFLFIFHLFILSTFSQHLNEFQYDDGLKSRVTKGRDSLEIWREKGVSNSCWRSAIESLEQGCKTMQTNSDERNRFAVRLANCHLENSGMQTYRYHFISFTNFSFSFSYLPHLPFSSNWIIQLFFPFLFFSLVALLWWV